MADSKIRLNQIQQDGASTGQFIRFDGTNWANSSVLLDNALSIANSTNNTKLAQFDASAISASTTRTYILPNASGTLALLSDITTAPAGTNYNLQYYNSGDLGADSNITVTPGANPKLGIGTSSPTAALHGKSWNDVGSPVILAENNSANDILAILSSGYIKLGDNESYPRFFSSTSNGTKSYTGQGFTFEGSFVVSSTTEIFSIGTPATDLSTGSYKILEIGGTFSPSTAATSTLSIINLTTTINQTSVTSGITRGINIAPASVTNLQDFRAVEIAINNSVAKGIYQSGASTTNNFVGNTAFGTTSAPNATNLIDIVSTTKSLGLPTMTSTERNAISSPRNGSVVYNSTDHAVSVRANGAWVNLGGGGGGIYGGSGTIASNAIATIADTFTFFRSTANTSTVNETITFDAQSSGTPAAGFGGLIYLKGQSSTTNSQALGNIQWKWYEATHLTRKSKITFSTIENGTAKNDVLVIGYDDATSGGVSVIETMVKVNASLFISADGSGNTVSTARKIGISNFSTGESAIFQFGDALNSLGALYGGKMLLQSYWGIDVYGSTQSGTPAAFAAGASTDPGMTVYAFTATRVPLVAKGFTSQSANLFEVRNSSNTVLSAFTSTGTLSVGSSSSLVISNTAFTTGGSYTVGNSANALTVGGSTGTITVSTSNASGIAINSTGTSTGVTITSSSTQNNVSLSKASLSIGESYAPTSAGSGTLKSLRIANTINQTGGHTGNTWGIEISPTLTAVGGTYYAIDIAANSASVRGIYQSGASTTNNFVGNTSFGTTTAPNATNLIDIVSTTKSLGLPAMTSTQRNAISSPRDGSVVYNSTDNAVSVRANSAWVNLGNGIYNGSGSIASSTVATLGTNISFRINYSNANAGLLINDTTNSVLISSRDGNKFLSADNTSVLIGDGATRMEYVGGVLRLYDSDATQYIGLQTPATANLTTSYTLTLPTSAGTNNSALTTNGSGTLTWRAVLGRAPIVGTTASSATPTPNADTDDVFTVTALSTGATFGAPTGTPSDGQRLTIRIKDNGSGQTLAYNAIYRAVGVTLPTTTVASKTIYLTMIYNSADTKWDVIAFSQEA